MILALAVPCLAEPTVRWRAPADCPQSAAFEQALQARFQDGSELRELEAISAEVARAGVHGYRLTLSAKLAGRAEMALRRLSAQRCAELVPAAVWLIVLAASPGATPLTPAAEPEPQVEARPAAVGESQGARSHQGAIASSGEPEAVVPSVLGSRAQPRASTPDQGASRAGDQAVLRSRADARTSTLAQADAATPALPAESSKSGEQDSAPSQPSALRKRPPLHVRISGLGGVFGGAGMGAQGTLGLAASFSLGLLHTQASLIDLLPAERSAGPTGHVQLWSLAARVSECVLWGERVRVGPCASVALLRTAAHSKDFGRDAHRAVVWGALELGLRVLWRFAKSLELSLDAGLGTPISPRPRFTVEEAGAVATVARWSQAAQLGFIYVVR